MEGDELLKELIKISKNLPDEFKSIDFLDANSTLKILDNKKIMNELTKDKQKYFHLLPKEILSAWLPNKEKRFISSHNWVTNEFNDKMEYSKGIGTISVKLIPKFFQLSELYENLDWVEQKIFNKYLEVFKKNKEVLCISRCFKNLNKNLLKINFEKFQTTKMIGSIKVYIEGFQKEFNELSSKSQEKYNLSISQLLLLFTFRTELWNPNEKDIVIIFKTLILFFIIFDKTNRLDKIKKSIKNHGDENFILYFNKVVEWATKKKDFFYKSRYLNKILILALRKQNNIPINFFTNKPIKYLIDQDKIKNKNETIYFFINIHPKIHLFVFAYNESSSKTRLNKNFLEFLKIKNILLKPTNGMIYFPYFLEGVPFHSEPTTFSFNSYSKTEELEEWKNESKTFRNNSPLIKNKKVK